MATNKFVNRAVKAGDRQERLHKPTYSGRDNPRHSGGLPVLTAFVMNPPKPGDKRQLEIWQNYGQHRNATKSIVVHQLR